MTRLPHNPLDRSPRDLRRDKPAANASTTSASSRRSWPVLARIGDATLSEERAAKSTTKSEKTVASVAPRTLRIDSPHVTIENQPAPVAARPLPSPPSPPPTVASLFQTPASTVEPAAKAVAPRPRAVAPPLGANLSDKKNTDKTTPTPRRSTHYLHRLPTLIRIAIRTWLVLSPYRSLIRAAVMFLLMALTGASTMIMMGGRLQPENTPPSSTSAAIEQPAPAEAPTNPGHLDPAIQTAAPSETSTSQESPTALGPITGDARELVAVESTDSDLEEPRLEPAPITAKPLAVTSIPENPTERYAPTPYPTTQFPTAQVVVMPYPVTPYPTIEECVLPRVQTTDPPPAVAKFDGNIEKIPPR